MLNFYLDFDTRLKRYFIAPFKQVAKNAYVISFDKRFEADTALKKLVSGVLKSPHEDSSKYDLVEVIKEEKGELKVYVLKK